jgi:N-sulfoglucosamine sulfohydrolase
MRHILSLLTALACASPVVAAEKLNIVFLTCEDTSPNLGCYGDPDAITPNLDKLASQGARFTRAFTHAPVCAPSRSGLITGQYPTTLGSHHMRSKLEKAPPMYTEYLRKAGYTICWPTGAGGIGKTDFNFDPPKGWSDVTEDWTKKPEVLKEPFFAVYNMTVTHESQARAADAAYKKNISRLKPEQIHDRTKVKLPPYYPDTPAVRECVGKYHDNITAMDYIAGDVLKLLDDRKLSDNTIVVFFGDHGWGLSRGKRWPYDSGLRVPLIVRWPGKVKAASVRDDLVCFLDLAPTVISLAGGAVPSQMQGRVMLGDKTQPAPKFVFAARDRMDETFDRVRSVRGEQYRYVRNFNPELPYFQFINYMDEMPIMKDWRKLAFEGKLNDTQKLFWTRTKPKEELYDLEKDPHEINNLASAESVAIQKIRKEMSDALDKWIKDTSDLGEVPEKELIKRGIVKDVLSTEYDARVKLHPKTPPVP